MGKAIIIGIEHHNTLSLVRMAGRCGYKVQVLLYGCSGGSYIEVSKYCDSISYVPDATSAVEELKILLVEMDEIPIILTGADQVSSLMDLEYAFFKGKCFFFNAGECGRITTYMDKQKQAYLAIDVGLEVPFTIEGTVKNITERDIPFPCIMKPLESIHGGKNIQICSNREELVASINSFSPGNTIILQQFVKGEGEIVVLGYSIKGQTQVCGFVKKQRDYKGGTTFSSTYPVSFLDQQLVDSCCQMLERINYSGLWGIEFIVSNGDYFFIELNLRNDATSYSLLYSGVDIIKRYCLEVQGQIAPSCETTFHSIDSMVEFEDFNFVLKRKVSLLRWLKQKKGCKCLYFYDEEDKRPYHIKKKKYIKFLQKKIFNI